jgi:ABC-type multidrug transport system fused ATPase/permease subunit
VLEEKVEKALQSAALWDEVKDRLHQSAFKLSGGQQQRLCVARALATDPELLLLDEPTSALDSETEAAVRETLVRLMRGRTVIAITHRLSTVNQFDRILVMQAGTLVQDGTPAELASRPGPFRDLLRAGERLGRDGVDELHAA